jgi:hypothetical protein
VLRVLWTRHSLKAPGKYGVGPLWLCGKSRALIKRCLYRTGPPDSGFAGNQQVWVQRSRNIDAHTQFHRNDTADQNGCRHDSVAMPAAHGGSGSVSH